MDNNNSITSIPQENIFTSTCAYLLLFCLYLTPVILSLPFLYCALVGVSYIYMKCSECKGKKQESELLV